MGAETSERKGLSARSMFGIAALAGLALTAATCASRPTRVARDGVTARVVATSGGSDAPWIAGDCILEGPSLRVVIGGPKRARAARGTILEARRIDAPPSEDTLTARHVVILDGVERPFEVRDVFVAERSVGPVVRIEGIAETDDADFFVRQELAIARVGTALTINTEVVPEAPREFSVAVTARLRLGGSPPFVPRMGESADETWRQGPWASLEGASLSAAVLDQEGPIRARQRIEIHGQERLHAESEISGLVKSIQEGQRFRGRTTVSFSKSGAGDAVRVLGWTTGAPFPELLVMLPYDPPGSSVRLRDRQGRPVAASRVPGGGRVVLPVPPGDPGGEDLVAVAVAYGHAESDPVQVHVARRARVSLEIPRGGRIRLRAEDATRGTPIDARVRFVGVRGTASPALGPDWIASGAGDALILSGDEPAVVPVQPGNYRVIVTRGPEWTLHDETVRVTSTFRPEVVASLEHVVDPGDWVPCDFHVHAAPSPDSEVDLEDRVRSLRAEGVRFAVPTDHNHITDYAPAIASLNFDGFGTVTGVEVTTWEPHFGHFNAFPVPLDPSLPAGGAPAYTGLTPATLFDALHAIGPDVIVQVNHPRLEGEIGYFDQAGFDPATLQATGAIGYSPHYDALEVWNGFDLARPDATERVFTEWLSLLAHGVHVTATGSSDSHQIRYQWAGYPRTYVRVDGARVTDGLLITRALREGRAFVTSGPFLEAQVGESGIGDTAQVTDGRVDVRVRVQAPPWMDVRHVEVFAVTGEGGVARVAEASIPAASQTARGERGRRSSSGLVPVKRFDGVLSFETRADTFVVVRARGDVPMDHVFGRQGIVPLAFTNPIWIDADQDGVWISPLARPAPVSDELQADPEDAGIARDST